MNVERSVPLACDRIVIFGSARGFPLVSGPVRMMTATEKLPIFENAVDDERFVLVKLDGEIQFAVRPFSLVNRALAGFVGIYSPGDCRPLELQCEGCRQSVAVVIEGNVPVTANRILGLLSVTAQQRSVMCRECRTS